MGFYELLSHAVFVQVVFSLLIKSLSTTLYESAYKAFHEANSPKRTERAPFCNEGEGLQQVCCQNEHAERC